MTPPESRPPLNFMISYQKSLLRLIFLVISFLSIGYSFFSDEIVSEKVLWVMDTSLSMTTRDVRGDDGVLFSRFDVAKNLVISGAVSNKKQNALFTFDSSARLQLPFSRDTDTFSAVVTGLDPKIYGGETDMYSAISSLALIYPHDRFHMILLTDGENSVTGSIYPDISPGIRVSIIGIGTIDGGRIVQGYDADGRPRYKQYHGEDVISRLDIGQLQQMVDQYGGKYYQVSYVKDIDSLKNISIEDIGYSQNKSHGFLYAGMMLFLVAIIMKPYKHGTKTI